MCFAFGFIRRCGSGGDIAFGVRPALRFYRRGCRAWRERGAGLRGDTLSVAAFWRSECVRHCGSVAGFAFGLRLPSRFCCGDLPLVHACLFSFVRKKETACAVLRSCSAGSRSPSCVLAASVRLSGVAGTRSWSARRYGFCRGDLPSVHVRHCGSVAGFCLWFASGIAVLLRGFAFGLRLPSRFYRRVCLWFTPVFFPLSGKKRRLAICSVPVPPGRDRHSCVLAVSVRLSAFVGSLRVWPFLYGDLDGLPGCGERGWRRSLCASLRSRISLVMLSAGSTLGLRAPDCAKESSTLWTLLRGWPSEKVRFTRRGWCEHISLQKASTPQSAHPRLQSPGTRKDPPGSNLWPGGSCCIAMLSTRSNVQTRAAPKRRGVGLQRAKRCGCRAQPCLETLSMLRRTASSVA